MSSLVFPNIIQIDYGSDAYTQMLALRDRLLRVPLGLCFTPEELARDVPDTHVVAMDNGQVVGGLIVTRHDDHAQLRQMVVDAGYQGTGLGLRLVQAAETWVLAHGLTCVKLHARVSAQGFYEKAGYEAFGNGFTQATVPHIAMRKQLCVN